MDIEIVRPEPGFLDGYVTALERGWRPGTYLDAEDVQRQVRVIKADPEVFLASLDDPDGRGEPVALPDGTQPRWRMSWTVLFANS